MTSATSVSAAGPLSTQTTASGFPRSQNPVVTLLQKRRGLSRLICVCLWTVAVNKQGMPLLFLPRDALVHSAVLRLHVVRLSVRL